MTKNLYDPSFEHDACGVGMVADLTATATNATILDALTILENLEHRGATGSDVDSGDGAGLLIQMPDSFLRAVFGEVAAAGGGVRRRPLDGAQECRRQRAAAGHRRGARARRPGVARVARRTGRLHGARERPRGPRSRVSSNNSSRERPPDPAPDLERALYCARKVIEHTVDVYASSCSPHVLIYKGMLTSPQLRQYFCDLRDERLTSAIAVVHSRFSTNVLPRWDLAQPFRYIAHNGEINTVRGNRNWMTARETTLA